MSIPQQPNSIDQILVGALPYPLYVLDRDFVVRQTNPRAEELGTKLGLRNVLPAEVRSQVNEAILQNQDLAGHDICRPVSFSNGQTYLPQIFRLAGVFSGHDGWAVLLVDGIGLGENAEVKAKTLRMLSHEVRTPLTSIRLSLLLLLEEKLGALNPDQRELLEVGRDECERMLTMLQSQLELARRESGTKLSPVATAPGND